MGVGSSAMEVNESTMEGKEINKSEEDELMEKISAYIFKKKNLEEENEKLVDRIEKAENEKQKAEENMKLVDKDKRIAEENFQRMETEIKEKQKAEKEKCPFCNMFQPKYEIVSDVQ